ncbi:hypothetical protein EON64_11485 [archaeon]|nr:MAG: hypothetical protein EON64_11485 [archaeon]
MCTINSHLFVHTSAYAADALKLVSVAADESSVLSFAARDKQDPLLVEGWIAVACNNKHHDSKTDVIHIYSPLSSAPLYTYLNPSLHNITSVAHTTSNALCYTHAEGEMVLLHCGKGSCPGVGKVGSDSMVQAAKVKHAKLPLVQAASVVEREDADLDEGVQKSMTAGRDRRVVAVQRSHIDQVKDVCFYSSLVEILNCVIYVCTCVETRDGLLRRAYSRPGKTKLRSR